MAILAVYIVNITLESIVQLYEEHTYAMSKQDLIKCNFFSACTKTIFYYSKYIQWTNDVRELR